MIRRYSAFTVIEIIITIGVILTLVGLSYAGYATVNQRQKLITAGQTLKNTLRDVQSRAFNGEADCNFCECNEPEGPLLDGWNVNLDDRVYYGTCGNGDFSISPLQISNEINIDNNNPQIKFIANPPSVDQDTNICLYSDNLPDNYYYIEINTSGEISDSGGLVDTCTP